MVNINRTISRKKAQRSKKAAKKNMDEKMKLHSMLPSECLACLAPFDNTNKEMIDTWYMIVHKGRGDQVNLYCPTCWEHAKVEVEKNGSR